MGSVPVLSVEDRNAVRILTLNRPEKRNALNSELTEKLLAALNAAGGDDSVGCVVLTGAALQSTGQMAPNIHPEQAVIYLAEAVT